MYVVIKITNFTGIKFSVADIVRERRLDFPFIFNTVDKDLHAEAVPSTAPPQKDDKILIYSPPNAVQSAEAIPDVDAPLSAQTSVCLLETGSYAGEKASKILLQPLTGRSHQLRVHCKYIGE